LTPLDSKPSENKSAQPKITTDLGAERRQTLSGILDWTRLNGPVTILEAHNSQAKEATTSLQFSSADNSHCINPAIGVDGFFSLELGPGGRSPAIKGTVTLVLLPDVLVGLVGIRLA
jgi:hypothetical protein